MKKKSKTKHHLSEQEVKQRLDENNGLMREQLKYLGLAALENVLTKKRLTHRQFINIASAPRKLMDHWLIYGYEDKRFVLGMNEKVTSSDGLIVAAHRRGQLGKALLDDDNNQS